MVIEENAVSYKRLCDNNLSLVLCKYNQFLFEKKQLEELIGKYNNFRSELYNLQQIEEELIAQNAQMESDLIIGQETAEGLERENLELAKILEIYNSRKIIRFSNNLHNIFSPPKKVAKKIITWIHDLDRYSKNKMQSKNLTQSSDKTKSTLNHQKLKSLKDIKVATILDEFSYNGFKYEFDSIPLDPFTWFEVLRTEKPDLFLCESAWSGGSWQGRIQYDPKAETENRTILLHILNNCKDMGIPTIFWNKEDPTNFKSFYDTALKFDHIFTTDEECVKLYEEYGHKSVHCLIFAGQPKLFNPIETHERTEDIIFAGSWYVHHKQRSIEMEAILDNILESGYGLKIYDRFNEFSKKHPNYRFPDKYRDYINPPVTHDMIGNIYKESKYALNINTVTKSKTMFARRVFELMLCNTLVLSNYSNGIYQLFNNNVVFISNEKIEIKNSKLKQINNLYDILKNHTYHNRFQLILNAIGFGYLEENHTVTLYYTVNSRSEIEGVVNHYKNINYSSKNLVIISDQISEDNFKDLIDNSIEYEFYKSTDISSDETVINRTPYFIFANTLLKEDFIEKAVLHFSYIEPEFGIVQGDRFIFKYSDKTENVLFSDKNFMIAIKNELKNVKTNFPVYNIQI